MGLKLLIENDLKCAEVVTAFPDSLEIFLNWVVGTSFSGMGVIYRGREKAHLCYRRILPLPYRP